ncbi:MAG TPA: bifunctional diaminohydroxyphosphoribosylaminopyrimidine deaminase/5-amino-6-(5-phosphoribosylamino)uracil reductase RibD [Methylophilus sp.]|nr:bifunctional diaminohydroxyphosphoribosylaminopyrimidine deaminase/5-amino-6-(5-phosphoribosylamino)uracil reductase RibD [Methylophilus sp.]HQQ33312.1 bifunctional diaminohydroxyphosphoribosylaminopyrimidine deaminase/5-amino-6-(5-phosphoribosylamino)uracil reductase RibD [Methylophilus sp.]
MFTAQDHALMAHALKLAELGLFTTTPNPRVGCVIAKNGSIIGQGAHLKAGEPHAEVHALREAGASARGATAYVTLEPCSHHGRTPPCVDALVKAGVSRVVAAMQDPNPLVSGQGMALLREHGIETQVGLMQPQSEELNKGFISRMAQGMPFVRSKIACSLDGKTALNNGQSKWITGEAARQDVQHWRAQSCAILTGIGTVLADNPRMTVRSVDIDRQPLRVIVDSCLQLPLDAEILKGGHILVSYAQGDADRAAKLSAMGVEVICLPQEDGKVCLKSLLRHLARVEINEVMVEAGAGLNGSLLHQHLIDELLIYQAPVLLGHQAQGMFDFPVLSDMQNKLQLQMLEMRQVGTDTRIRAKPTYVNEAC